MQTLPLTFYPRMILGTMIGNHGTQSLKEASVFLRIIEKVRLSDKEQQETEFKQEGSQYSWKLPTSFYGNKDVELEADEAKALAAGLDGGMPVKVSDAEWLTKVVDQLRIAEPNSESKTEPKPITAKRLNGKEARA